MTGVRRFIVSATVGAVVCAVLLNIPTGTAGASNAARSPAAPTLPTQGIAVQIAAGHAGGCERLLTTRVSCWGSGVYGASKTAVLRPTIIPGLSGVREVAVGFGHSCALMLNGTVRCWGLNDNGQLGDASTNNSHAPVLVHGVARAIGISLGFEHSCALLASLTARCWGWNYYGQLGDGTHSTRWTAHRVVGLRGIRQLATGFGDSCAIVGGGSIFCWGQNKFGQLGNGTFTSSPRPVRVGRLTHVRSLSLGFASSCAAVQNGRVYCWGRNNFGQLGDGTTRSSPTPTLVRGITGAIQVTVGFGHACALRSSHTARCWGWDGHGQLGTGGRVNRLAAFPVRPLAGATELAAGDDATCALLGRLRLYTCWGYNSQGALGNGSLNEELQPSYLPGMPQGVRATPGVDAAIVTWRAPRTFGLGAITQYVVRAVDYTAHRLVHLCSWSTGPLACTVTNLTNGHDFRITVLGRNVAGAGAVAGPLRTYLRTQPGAPQTVAATATVGGGGATVTWGAAFNGGLRITSYIVTAIDETSTTRGGQRCTWTTEPKSCSFTNLTNGDTYRFAVVAHSAAGNSLPGLSPPVTPLRNPFPPTNLVAKVGDTKATVTWVAPTDNGGSPITGYTVTATDQTTAAHGNQTCIWPGGALTCTPAGLTNGDTYVFTVTAKNAAGISSASLPSNAIVPVGLPAAPTSVIATLTGSGAASVSWVDVPPASDGGSPITGYTVTAADATNAARGGQQCTGASAATSCAESGLTNGDSYTFTVVATTTVGSSPPSTPSGAVTPFTVPDPPSGATATVTGSAQARVSWTAPFNEGSPITNYTVTASGGGNQQCTASPPTTNCTVTGLTNGTSYTFTVTATNAAGPGGPSGASNSVTPSTGPGAPTGASASGGDGQAQVSWNPGPNGGSPITGYTVTASGGGNQQCTSTPPTTNCTVPGLTNGVSYTFTVTETNANGTSPPSAPSNAVVPAGGPSAPTGVTASAGNGSADVSWSAASPNGSPITNYTVTASGGGNQQCTSSPPTTHCTVNGLTNGTSYTFTVTATNGIGTSGSSAATSAVTPSTVPDPPSGVTASVGIQSSPVSWTAPSDGGNAITVYTVTAADSTTPGNGGEQCTSAPPTTNCTVNGLTTGDTYTFTVVATNGNGDSNPSSPSNSVIPL
jgi:alpha-tubulin suppressor-like RCC1 family protein